MLRRGPVSVMNGWRPCGGRRSGTQRGDGLRTGAAPSKATGWTDLQKVADILVSFGGPGIRSPKGNHDPLVRVRVEHPPGSPRRTCGLARRMPVEIPGGCCTHARSGEAVKTPQRDSRQGGAGIRISLAHGPSRACRRGLSDPAGSGIAEWARFCVRPLAFHGDVP
jgi:hypothetical protein